MFKNALGIFLLFFTIVFMSISILAGAGVIINLIAPFLSFGISVLLGGVFWVCLCCFTFIIVGDMY